MMKKNRKFRRRGGRYFWLLTGLLFAVFPVAGQINLSLEQAKKLALENNERVQVASEQLQTAKFLRKAAFTQFLPSFSANGTYTHLTKQFQLLNEDKFLPVIPYTALDNQGHLNPAALSNPAVAVSTLVINPATGQPVTDSKGNPVFQNYSWLPASESQFGSKNIWLLQAGFTQPLFMGGKILETYKIAKYTEELAGSAYDQKVSELLYDVEMAYWRVVSLQEKEKLAQTYRKAVSDFIENLRNYYQEGSVTKNDLLKGQVKLNEADLAVMKAGDGSSLAQMALCQLIGMPMNVKVFPVDTLPADLAFNTSEQIDSAVDESRPELQQLARTVDIARSGVKLMRSRFLPNLALTGGPLYSNPNPYKGFSNDFGDDFMIGVVCNIPIFHWGERVHTMQAAEHEQKAVELKLKEARELIGLQLNQSKFLLQEAGQKVLLSSKALEQAQENLSFTQSRFAEGMMKASDVLEAQAQWQKSWSDAIDARADLKLSYCNYLKAAGKLNQ